MVKKSLRTEPISKIVLDHVTLADLETNSLILKNVDFEIPLNRNYNVVSQEQSHASAFLKFISLLYEPQTGALQFDHLNATESQFDDILPLRLTLGYAFDYGGLMRNRTLFQNLLLPLEYHSLYTANEREDRIVQLLKWFDLLGSKDKLPSEVTGRVRKLVCLLRSFVHSPQILILDDPAIGLSNEMKETLIHVLKEQLNKKEIQHLIFSSQDSTWNQNFAHDEIVIEEECLYLHPRHWEKNIA